MQRKLDSSANTKAANADVETFPLDSHKLAEENHKRNGAIYWLDYLCLIWRTQKYACLNVLIGDMYL